MNETRKEGCAAGLTASPRSGVPNLQAVDWYWSGPVRNWATHQKVGLNVMSLNHPETIPPLQSMEKLSSTKLVPGAEKVRDHCPQWYLQYISPVTNSTFVVGSYTDVSQVQ